MVTLSTIGTELAKGIVYFSIGFCGGWILRGYKEKMNSNIDNEKVIALLVACVWAISVLVDMVNASYETPIALHGLMGGIVGYYYKRTLGKNEKP